MAALTYISCFSGIAGMDLALRIAIPDSRCIGYVENEAVAAAFLASQIKNGTLDDAPIWSDIRSFPSELYRGRVAGIIGGWPCPPVSVAGLRKGNTDERWLWPDLFRIICDTDARWFFGENVRGLMSANRGDAFAEVLRDLATARFDAEWGIFSAAECGAPQKRERLFILAHRPGARFDGAARSEQYVLGSPLQAARLEYGDGTMANTGRFSEHRIQSDRLTQCESSSNAGDAGSHVDDARRSERRTESQRCSDSGEGVDGHGQEAGWTSESSEGLANTSDTGLQERPGTKERPGAIRDARYAIAASNFDMENSDCSIGERNARTGTRSAEENGPRSHFGPTGPSERFPLWPPGPGDADGWRYVLERWPELAPAVEDAPRIREHGQEREDGGRDGEASGELADAKGGGFGADGSASGIGGHADECGTSAEREEETEPEVRSLVDGNASELPRTDQLRAIGNMVVPLTGALALTILMQRAGIKL